jgi:hydrogenase expression/formation protein HypC
MCIGLPGLILEMVPDQPNLARVVIQGVTREVSLALLDGDPPRPGEWVLIQLGLALERMTEAEAREAIEVLEALGSAAEDDLFLSLESTAPNQPGPPE